ncbi:threonine/serine ThrE exporter family protein [Agromyces archimandritae]|uniref:Threonine/serine exporter family protein n=1 Tax=Agromyces archimandritae TaxID=2781962 RepID=A0A975FQC4_9MICO|nr:threonine/serine exporter family protein [Agromyces archimandritae]QTX05882.1 threonine/serine exporter family protein [Agromyces archimandritae]
MAEPVDRAVLRRFLLGLAEGMNAARASVEQTRETMGRVARAYGEGGTDFVVLPTLILVQTGDGDERRLSMRSATTANFRFDQVDALYRLIASAERGGIDPAAGIRRLNEIGAMRPHFGWVLRTLGHAILTAGLALMLVPSWQSLAIAAVLGGLLGALKLVRSQALQLVLPVVAAFVSALAVFLIALHFPVGDPIRVLIAPLATFLPGALLTTGTMELAEKQMVAGASRLMMGLVQLALLAFGIIAAGTIVGVADDSYEPAKGAAQLPWWVPVIGVVLYAVGTYLHHSAPARTFGWVLLVLLVAYAAQTLGSLAGAAVSGFVGALAMTPLVLWISGLPRGVPSQLTFLPGFSLLVPGSAGVIGLTSAVGAAGGLGDFAAAMVSVMSIALGVLIGTALFRVARTGAEELFHIDMPAEGPPHPWQRLATAFSRPFLGRRRRRRLRLIGNSQQGRSGSAPSGAPPADSEGAAPAAGPGIHSPEDAR